MAAALVCVSAAPGASIAAIHAAGAPWCHVDVKAGYTECDPVYAWWTAASDAGSVPLLDAHLLSENLDLAALSFVGIARRITVDCERGDEARRVMERVKAAGCLCGIAIGPDTPVKTARAFLPLVDTVLVIASSKHGFTNGATSKIDKLVAWREADALRYHIAAIGGINEVTGRICREHGAHTLVTSDSYFTTSDKRAFVSRMALTNAVLKRSRTSARTLSQIRIGPETKRIIRRIKAMAIPNEMSDIARSVLAKRRCPPLCEEWHVLRGRLLTASDMAACLGENPYCSQQELFKRKTQQGPGFKGNIATRWGQKYEPEAADVYSALTGLDLVEEEIGLIVHDYEKTGDAGRKRYAATPDFITLNGIMVEIKCPFSRKITHTIPHHYMAQVQFQLEAAGSRMAHFVQYKPPSCADTIDGIMDIMLVPRDPTWWVEALPVLDTFWDSVIMWFESRGLVLGEKHGFEYGAESEQGRAKRKPLVMKAAAFEFAN